MEKEENSANPSGEAPFLMRKLSCMIVRQAVDSGALGLELRRRCCGRGEGALLAFDTLWNHRYQATTTR